MKTQHNENKQDDLFHRSVPDLREPGRTDKIYFIQASGGFFTPVEAYRQNMAASGPSGRRKLGVILNHQSDL